MTYEIRDYETGQRVKCKTSEIRSTLFDMFPQRDNVDTANINFIADYYEGKHSYLLTTCDVMNSFNIVIFNTGQN